MVEVNLHNHTRGTGNLLVSHHLAQHVLKIFHSKHWYDVGEQAERGC